MVVDNWSVNSCPPRKFKQCPMQQLPYQTEKKNNLAAIICGLYVGCLLFRMPSLKVAVKSNNEKHETAQLLMRRMLRLFYQEERSVFQN